MPAWLSPFPLSAATLDQLQQAGYTAWEGVLGDLPADGVLLYDTPDRCFGLGPEVLRDGYQQLQHVSAQRRVVSICRLLDLEPYAGPLETALTFALIQAAPDLLEAYLDLELKADLLGGEPDVAYRRRLAANLQPGQLLAAWQELQNPSVSEAQLEALTTAEQEAREEAELTLLQLHQVQEELEEVFLADREKAAELERLKQQLADGEALQAKLSSLTSAEEEAREEAELTLLQLHQVQEELEHYFLLSRGQSQQLERYNQLQRRSQRLLAKVAAPKLARSASA